MQPKRGLGDRKDADPRRIVAALLDHGVEFVVIGGVAAIAHGVQRITRDIDLLLEPSAANRRRAIGALITLEAEELRATAKRWVPVSERADPDWLLREPRSFDSAAGGIDICNAMAGAPDWGTARKGAIEVTAFGRSFLVLDKDTLIRSKLAAGREKDRQDVAELADLPEDTGGSR